MRAEQTPHSAPPVASNIRLAVIPTFSVYKVDLAPRSTFDMRLPRRNTFNVRLPLCYHYHESPLLRDPRIA